MENLRAWGAQLMSSVQEALQTLVAYLPVVLLAASLIVVGWLLARLLRNLTMRGIGRLDWVFSAARDAEGLQQATARAAATVVFWAVILSFLAAALRSLGWPVVEAWMEDLIAFLPVLVGGIAIILLGFIGGALIRHIVEPAAASVDLAYSGVLGRLSQAVLIVTGFIVGTSQLGIDVSFVIQLITVLVGAALAGVALSLALGTREHLSNLVGTRYARKRYHVGERVRVGDFEGRIIEISDGCLFLETEHGDVSIPGTYFTREPFVKLADGAANER